MLTKFWEEVAQAHDKVSANHKLRVVVERDQKRAEVIVNAAGNGVIIVILDAETETVESLPAP